MIDRSHELPITSQARALNISRSGVYYRPRAVPAADLAIMRRMDELHLDFPFAGSVRSCATAPGRRGVAWPYGRPSPRLDGRDAVRSVRVGGGDGAARA